MPRYYFYVEEGGAPGKGDSADLANLDAARKESVQFASDMLAEIDGEVFNKDWGVRVTNGDGLTLYEITVVATVAPAAMATRRDDQ